VRAFKISRENRALLRACGVDRPALMLRWAGELPEGGVITVRPDGGYRMSSGACGHYSLFRWRLRLHRHPGDLPVPEDMKAALRGEAAVPEWFQAALPMSSYYEDEES
jgi:hypothetical protein